MPSKNEGHWYTVPPACTRACLYISTFVIKPWSYLTYSWHCQIPGFFDDLPVLIRRPGTAGWDSYCPRYRPSRATQRVWRPVERPLVSDREEKFQTTGFWFGSCVAETAHLPAVKEQRVRDKKGGIKGMLRTRDLDIIIGWGHNDIGWSIFVWSLRDIPAVSGIQTWHQGIGVKLGEREVEDQVTGVNTVVRTEKTPSDSVANPTFRWYPQGRKSSQWLRRRQWPHPFERSLK
jgi:hypothetical protein